VHKVKEKKIIQRICKIWHSDFDWGWDGLACAGMVLLLSRWQCQEQDGNLCLL